MILQYPLGRRVCRGDKTVHRYPVAEQTRVPLPGHLEPRWKDARCAFQPEHFYEVQEWKWATSKDGGEEITYRSEPKPLCHIRVTSVARGKLADMTEADALAEGYDSLSDFREAWWERHRFGHNSPRHVWVVTFRVEEDVPRLLAARGGYTSSSTQALNREPEAVDKATEDRYADEARERFKRELEQERTRRKSLEPAKALELALRDAQSRGVDVSGDLRVVRKRIDAMKRKADAA